MKILQIILSAILFLRIGGILFKKVDVNDENQWFCNLLLKNCSLLGIVISAYFTKGIISLILIDVCIVHISVFELSNKKSNKKLRTTYIIVNLFFLIMFTMTFFAKHGTSF